MEIESKYHIAIQAAVEASKLLLEYYSADINPKIKLDGSPVTEADLASSLLIRKILSQTNIPIVDEESEHASYELRKNWIQSWCVDPLDGTKEFIKKNGEFAINIALIENQKAIFGLIASPVNHEIIIGSKTFGVFIFDFNDAQNPNKWRKILSSIEHAPLNIIISRSHESEKIKDFIRKIEQEFGVCGIINKGSSLKFFDLAQNKASIYPRFAPTMEWDIAAGQAILECLEGEVLHAEKFEPLIYNKEDLRNPHFVALNKDFVTAFVQ